MTKKQEVNSWERMGRKVARGTNIIKNETGHISQLTKTTNRGIAGNSCIEIKNAVWRENDKDIAKLLEGKKKVETLKIEPRKQRNWMDFPSHI